MHGFLPFPDDVVVYPAPFNRRGDSVECIVKQDSSPACKS